MKVESGSSLAQRLVPGFLLVGAFTASALAADATNAIGGRSHASAIADRLACSSLVRARESTVEALREVSVLGFKWVELSCVNWAPHVAVAGLLKDFDGEATRVEAALQTNGLQVASLIFDAPDTRPFESYEREFEALVRLAARLKARLINIMAPSAKADRTEMVRRLRRLQAIAARAGVILTLETHCDQLTERPADALWLCEQVPGLRLTLDPSHYYAGPNQGAAFDTLYPLVEGTGFRAGGMSWKEIQLPWGEGPIDFSAVVRRLQAAGYKGFYVVEYIQGFNDVDAARECRRFRDWAGSQ